MGWFKKQNKHSEVEEARRKLNAKFEYLASKYNEPLKQEENTPIIPVTPVGSIWREIMEGINVVDADFPYDKEKYVVVVLDIKKGATIKPHKHKELEIIYAVSGMYKEGFSGSIDIGGDIMKFKPLTPHSFEFIEDTTLIVQWLK